MSDIVRALAPVVEALEAFGASLFSATTRRRATSRAARLGCSRWLEGMIKELKCDVILSEDLFKKQVERHVNTEPLDRIKVKGRDQEVMVAIHPSRATH